MTENEFNYWAFLSYSLQDNRAPRSDTPTVASVCWGNWLHDVLKNFSIPADFIGQVNARGEIIPEKIQPIFQDDQESPANASLSAETRQALTQSRCLIVICSPRSAQSLHVNEAVRYFKQLGRGNRILPIIVAGEPNVTDSNQPGTSSADECFVPALRHPVNVDGTLDTTRRDRGSIFADARYGSDKREILTQDDDNAEAGLEISKIKLIAGLIGVGFNGLWSREQQRRFTGFAKAEHQTRVALSELAEARNQIRAAQNQVLEKQNLPSDVHRQIQDAQNQAHETQRQLQELQAAARDTQSQLAETRQQVRAAEGKVLEAQQQAREAQQQLESARQEARAAQDKALEAHNLSPDLQRQIQETQNQFQAAQQSARAAQSQVQEFQNQVRDTQGQLAAARDQVRAAEAQVASAQQQARDAQEKVEAIQDQTRDAQNQIQAAQEKALAAEKKVGEVQDQVQASQTKTRAARRLAKVLALLAVLAALAASMAWWQRQVARQTLAKVSAPTDVSAVQLNQEQIRQALQQANAAGVNQPRALDELAAQIPTEEIPAALQTASALLDDRQRTQFQKQLLARFGAVNFQSALTNASAIESKIVNANGARDSNFYLQLAALDGWSKTDLSGAFNWVRQLTNTVSQSRALEQIVPALAADNLTNTLAALNDFKPAPGEPSYTLLFQRWAATNPVQAIEQRPTLSDRDADAKILSVIITTWSERHPAAAVNWLQSQPETEALPAGTWRDTLLAEVFTHWSKKDLDAATTACEQLPEGAAKEKSWAVVLSQRIEKNPAAAAELVKNLPPGDHRQKAIAALCRQWANTDATAASQFANQHPELSGEVLGDIAVALAKTDLTAATNWVASLPDGPKKFPAQSALSEIWAQTDPKRLAAFALGLPASETQTLYLTAACRHLARHDLPGTVELLQSLPVGELKQNILEQAGRSCDWLHINSAAKFISALPAGDDQKALINGLLSKWSNPDPESAVNWLRAFPETNLQTERVQSAIQAWSQTEPAAVAKWLAKLPIESASNEMINAFLAGAVAQYPEFAAQWTQSVTDETRRQQLQIQVARQWMKTDSTAATKWLGSLNLPEANQQLK